LCDDFSIVVALNVVVEVSVGNVEAKAVVVAGMDGADVVEE
jgi:hypothetical protein